jgi:hypothetical protein
VARGPDRVEARLDGAVGNDRHHADSED